MFTIKNITIKNFMSVGNVTQTINFSDSELVLVLGENLDLGGNDSRNGVGKAQPLYSKIKIPNGWTTMGDVSIGDVVSTPDGNTANVTHIFPQGNKKTYRVHFCDGRYTDACEDHLWKVFSHSFNTDDKYKIITTKDIIAHKYKHTHLNGSKHYSYVDLAIPEDIPNIDLPIHPYLLGAILGDGCVSNNLGFTSSDEELVETLQTCLPFNTQLYKSKTKKYQYSFKCIVREKKRVIKTLLENLHLINTKSDTKFIPEIYKNASTKQKIELIAGLVDTDGYVSSNGALSITTVSEKMANDIQGIIWSIGGIANITRRTNKTYTHKGEKRPCKDSYTIRIKYNSPKKLSKLTRKKDRLPGENYQYKNRKLRIENIEYIGEIESKCIMIDHSDHLYITDDYIVTHNSTIVNALSYALYGEALVKIKLNNLINKINTKGMAVTLDFEKDGQSYRIERGRRKHHLRFIVNGKTLGGEVEEDTDEAQGDNRLTQKEIERVINLSHAMFKHIVALNTYTEPFLALRANDQREIIEQLLGITNLSEKADKLKESLKDVRDQIKGEEFKIKATQQANKRIEENIRSIESKSKAWTSGQTQKCLGLQSKLEKMLVLEVDNEIAAHKHNAAQDKIKNDNNALKREITALEKEITLHNKNLTLAEKSLSMTAETNICPTCNQDMDTETHQKVHIEFTIQADESKYKIKKREEELSTLNANLYTDNIDIRDTFYSDIDDAYDHKNKLDTLSSQLEKQLELQNPYIEQIDTLRDDGIQEVNFDNMNDLTSLKDHQEFLMKLLTNKDSFIRKKIIDQNLLYLNNRLSGYLVKMGLPHEVQFKSDLEVEITQYGRDYDFDNLSRGERTRLILSLSWAFRDVYESLNDKINMLFIDELIDGGLDTSGVESSLTVLKKMTREQKRNVFLISHRDELVGRVTSVLKVIKSGGYTSFDSTDTNLI